jgi:hypothetical protein
LGVKSVAVHLECDEAEKVAAAERCSVNIRGPGSTEIRSAESPGSKAARLDQADRQFQAVLINQHKEQSIKGYFH